MGDPLRLCVGLVGVAGRGKERGLGLGSDREPGYAAVVGTRRGRVESSPFSCTRLMFPSHP